MSFLKLFVMNQLQIKNIRVSLLPEKMGVIYFWGKLTHETLFVGYTDEISQVTPKTDLLFFSLNS